MENDLQQATIKIEEIIDKEKVVKIKAGGRTYNVFKKKKDGTDSIAYRNINDMGLKAGMTVDIGFKDSQYDYQGTMTTSHNIAFFREPSIQVDNQGGSVNYDEINAKKAQDIKEAQEIRAQEFEKLIFALDNLTNKIDQVLAKVKDTSKEANVNGEDVDVSDIPFN